MKYLQWDQESYWILPATWRFFIFKRFKNICTENEGTLMFVPATVAIRWKSPSMIFESGFGSLPPANSSFNSLSSSLVSDNKLISSGARGPSCSSPSSTLNSSATPRISVDGRQITQVSCTQATEKILNCWYHHLNSITALLTSLFSIFIFKISDLDLFRWKKNRWLKLPRAQLIIYRSNLKLLNYIIKSIGVDERTF